ncbi:MAG: GDSL-type esterase/lipase family protein [Myxococcota bacterium]
MAPSPDSSSPSEAGKRIALRAALVRLVVAGGVVIGAGVLALLIPPGASVVIAEADSEESSDVGVSFGRLRPWNPGDPAPLSDLFSGNHEEVPEFAGAGYRASGRRLEEKLGAAVAQNLGSADPLPPAPADDDGPRVRIDPAEYEGIEVRIEHPERIQSFFTALEATARRQGPAVTRISHYGDSSIATDLITHTVRRRLQRRFGDAGHGFLLIARGTMPYGHRDVSHAASSRWDVRQIVNNADRDGLYGFGGVSYRAQVGAYATFGTDDRGPVGGAVSLFQVYYRQEPNGGEIQLRVDGGEPRRISTAGEERDRVEIIRVPDGAHELEIRPAGGGPIRLYGVALERDRAGVVYDSLGLVGARARRLLNYNSDHIREQMTQRDPDLLVLGFGGNEADDPIRRIPRYEGEFRQVIRRMRGSRDRACLIFGPLDQARRDEYGRIVTIPTVPMIIEAQRAAAAAEGCAFFDTFGAMGGEGSITAWARSRPRLAMTDYRHATPAGYEVIGNLFYKAVLEAFARHLNR